MVTITRASILQAAENEKQKIEELLNIQEKHEVHIMRAKLILQNNYEPSATQKSICHQF